MRKAAFIVFLSVAVAATNQLVIQPLLRSVPIAGVTKTARSKNAHTASVPAGAEDPLPALSAPISGYVADPAGRGAIPIVGFRMFAFLGDTLDFGEDVGSIISSPNQNYAAEIDRDGATSLWVPSAAGLSRVTMPGDLSLTTSIRTSPSGFSMAVTSAARGIVQVFTSVPNQPSLSATVRMSELGGAPSALAVSDDGATVLFSIAGAGRDSIYSWQQGQNGGAPVFVADGMQIASLAFAPNSSDAVAADGFAGKVFLLRSQSGSYSALPLADGLRTPVAAEFSRDGQKVVVADSGTQTVSAFTVDGLLSASAGCNCNPQFLRRLIGNAVFQLTDFDGNFMELFDGDSEAPFTMAIGHLPQAHESGGRTRTIRDVRPATSTTDVSSTSLTTGSIDANCNATPALTQYFATNTSVIYPWMKVSNITVTPNVLTAQVKNSAGTLVGTRLTLGNFSTCAFGGMSISLAAGNYTMAFFVNGTEVPSAREIAFSMVDPTVTLSTTTGVSGLPGANQQGISVAIKNALPTNAAVSIGTTFTPSGVVYTAAGSNPGYDCRVLNNGTTQVNSTPTISTAQLQTPASVSYGTVSGTCSFKAASIGIGGASIPANSNSVTGSNSAGAPVLNTPATPASSGSFNLALTGWSTTRDLTAINFTFTAKSGFTIGTSTFTVDVSNNSAAFNWFTSAASASTGGSFLFNQAFTVGGGVSSNLQSVTITATNRQGTSAPVTVNF